MKKEQNTDRKTLSPVRRLAVSAMFMALFCAVMYCTQSFAFGAYQIRIATSLYAFGYFFPFLILPMGLANALSILLMGSFGLFDILGGFAAGVLTTGCAALIQRIPGRMNKALLFFPVTLIPGLLVPLWLAPALGMGYWALALNLCIGQAVAGIFGVLLAAAAEPVWKRMGFLNEI